MSENNSEEKLVDEVAAARARSKKKVSPESPVQTPDVPETAPAKVEVRWSLPEEVINGVFQYLGTKPYTEVSNLISIVQQSAIKL